MSYTVCLEEEPDRLSLVANVLSVVTFAIAIVVPLQYYARPTSDINQVIEALDSGLAHEYELVLHQMRKIQELNLPGNIIAVTSGRPWAETLQESSDLLTEASDKLWRSSKAGSRFWRIVFLVRHDENVELAKKAKCKQLRKMSEIDNDDAERKQNVEFGNRIHRTLLEMWSDQKKELLKIVLNAGLLALAHVPLHL